MLRGKITAALRWTACGRCWGRARACRFLPTFCRGKVRQTHRRNIVAKLAGPTFPAASPPMLAVSPGVVVADYARLLEDVRAVVRHELQHHAPPAPADPAAPADELLSLDAAAELLGVTVQTVHEWKRRGLLKYHKLGSRSYLKRAEMLGALKAQQRSAKPSKGAGPAKGTGKGKGAARA